MFKNEKRLQLLIHSLMKTHSLNTVTEKVYNCSHTNANENTLWGKHQK